MCRRSSLLTGKRERGSGRRVKSYDLVKAWPSMNHSICLWLRMCLCQQLEVEFEEEGDVEVGIFFSVFVLSTLHCSS